jgi:hypothetical protein
MSSNTTDLFDYKLVNNDLITLQAAYEEFYKAMLKIDFEINSSIQIFDSGALYGDKGIEFLREWNEKCAGFKNYYYLFKSWTNKVIEVGKEYGAVAASVFGENAKTISFDSIKEFEDLKDFKILISLVLGIEELDGQKIKTIKDGDDEYVIVGGKKYFIIRDDTGKISNVITEGGTKIDKRIVEEKINVKYEAYKADKITQEDWNSFVEGLNEEGKNYIKYLETGVTLYRASEVESLLKDYASSDLLLTGVGSLSVYPGDVAISKDGMPYEFMGLGLYEMGYCAKNPKPIFRSLNDGNEEYYNSYDGWKKSVAYTYENGEFVRMEGTVGNYVADEFNQGFTAMTFDDGTGPVKVIRGNVEIPEGAYLALHQYGIPDINDSSVVTVSGSDFFKDMWSTVCASEDGWKELPKVIYVPGDKSIKIDSGLPFGVFSTKIKPNNGQGFYMIRDDNSYSYWRLEDNGIYYEFNGNDGRIPIGSLPSTSLK